MIRPAAVNGKITIPIDLRGVNSWENLLLFVRAAGFYFILQKSVLIIGLFRKFSGKKKHFKL